MTDDPVRVIQIWYAAGLEHRGLSPHYQQLQGQVLPNRRAGDATVHCLIGDDSPMEQHMLGRLTATTVDEGGTTPLEPPRAGEDLFLYVTDGAGWLLNGEQTPLGQYDVILASPETPAASIQAMERGEKPPSLRSGLRPALRPGLRLQFLSFYLPSFLRL
jgi:redox-sensitive bicupin YhaK (pirin superfamily)